MQLSPLQSRLAASLVASCLLVLIYLALFSSHFALAEDVNLARPPSIPDDLLLDGAVAGALADPLSEEFSRVRTVDYEPEFGAFDRSIIGRAPAGVTGLANNVPQSMNVEPGSSQVFVFEKSSIKRARGGPEKEEEEEEDLWANLDGAQSEVRERSEILRRQATRTVYVSANTCMQPQPVADTTRMDPPQLTMYISLTNPLDGDGGSGKVNSTWHVFKEGAATVNVSTSEDVFIKIAAPTIANAFTGIYNFEVAASLDTPYHSFSDQATPDLVWVDSDASAALLMTKELTNSDASFGALVDQSASAAPLQQQRQQQPYVMFAHNGDDRSINGVRYSYCGLRNYAQIAAVKDGQRSSMVQTSITSRRRGSGPKQQFFLSGLNASSRYVGILATAARSNAVGGGGLVFRSTDFTTRQADGGNNCQLITNLGFCDQVAYAVPSNPTKFNTTQLANFYDSYAQDMYGNFKKALAQIQCETSSTQRYSLARSCDDCERAYKDWLCYVTIPRCEDFGTPADRDWLWPRNINQSFPDGRTLSDDDLKKAGDVRRNASTLASRNPKIDSVVAPGPYKELLPCDGLCYDMVQSCPAALKFKCPTINSGHSYRGSYQVNVTAPSGGFKCNSPEFERTRTSAASDRRCGLPSSILLYGLGVSLALAML